MPSPRLLRAFTLSLGFAVLGMLGLPRRCAAVETVTFKEDGRLRTVVGELLVEVTGGLMLQSDDGRVWLIRLEQVTKRESNDEPLEPIDAEQMEERLLKEFPAGFQTFRTSHYVIVYNSTEDYAKRVARLFEELYSGFHRYWRNQKWELPDPKFPLVAVVLKDHESFRRYGRADIGDTVDALIGYYNLKSNRVITFKVPNWERNHSTIVHEATHQLAFNRGLQERFADNPKWVSEGLAMYFEAPDPRNPGRYKSVGRPNLVNLVRWRKYLPNRPAESLTTLLADDDRFLSSATSLEAYGEAWALTYFLIKTKRKEYVHYLQQLSGGRPTAEVSKRERIRMFEEAFEMPLAKLDKAFVAYMNRVRAR